MSDLDDALDRFQARSFEYAGGLSNHGPMAVEALAELGHAALIPGFVDVYEPRLPPAEEGEWIAPAERATARGCADRLGDWRVTFERELEEADWRDLVRREVAAMTEGLFAGGTHGLLRVAHALRALDREDTAPRRRELAFGFAYWAGRYQVLPGNPGRQPKRGRGPAEILAETGPVAASDRIPGFFTAAVAALDTDARFAEVIESVDLDALDLEAFLGELCRSAAALYLRNPQARVAYVHAVTAPSALRFVAPYLEPEIALRAAGVALQAAAALHAVSAAEPTGEPGAEVQRLAEDPAQLRYRAACSLKEHAIKFSEACLREDSLHPDPVLRLAAADGALHL